MALGRSKISKVQNLSSDIRGEVNGTIADCWNTFNYVSQSLSSWASETEIGSESRENAQKLADCLKQMIDAINTHQNNVDSFLNQQIQLNKD